MLNYRTLIYVLMESITVQVVSRLTLFEFTKQENMLCFVCSRDISVKTVKLKISHTVILPLAVSLTGKFGRFTVMTRAGRNLRNDRVCLEFNRLVGFHSPSELYSWIQVPYHS